ncbi:FAD:protein FMN transferase [Streptomyces sp. H10-C2]|uniref:FAD:protein FMN transferase n=1 Tax=unclassified Streptomyces TaxID=2593676 RepID=UPI0024BB19D5|nr:MULTISPECIES: FAD:protein FMN transferase [unclassified Streptomyces]MDJ0344731.1 FAD:protein FMN transferase [Streptomyces sp. PH10-H1]MDJ0371221.1 FAD:protein FMN transferase [Streptomyces sp. H10-C2]
MGITPLRALFETLPARPGDLTLLYRARTSRYLALRGELESIAAARGARLYYAVNDPDGTRASITARDGWFSARYAGSLDPTGLVKGWAVERAAAMLRSSGADTVCVNGGGDVQLHGGPWRVGVADPLRPGRIAARIETSHGLAVATSGPAERGCHILDPRTGAPPAPSLASITVIGRSLTEADAWATAPYAMGAARARGWLEQLPGTEAFAVASDGSTWQTSGFARTAVPGPAQV